ncbi:phospho-N-acetylmuramoyl-pentapeptide-transferase [Myxosarcina sp. GI1]|uniref:phospho-N-acetylmuramoyl-pentapeptide- transferase n=1 Tax=Myxosarcina sp. GI1 TaxID=1541065 RepID=UPI0005640D7F|nr:phospho-N-acetylmuramoyl-pentapeptide-transferase [Myxosarcina sp. GI1]
MGAKSLSTPKSFAPSGLSLLVALSSILLLGAIALDGFSGRFANGTDCLVFPLLTSGVISILLGWAVIPWLNRLKTGQIIREDGPQTHLQKAGTPTMGGIFFVPVAVSIALVWTQFNWETVAVALVTLSYGSIGWLDDWQVLRRKSNKGISPKTKLLLQIAVGILFALWLLWQQLPAITTISLPGFDLSLGLLILPLIVFVLAAESNATNLTDGVDGLAAGTGAIASLALAAIVAPSSPDLMIFCACLSGSCLGFLVYNRNPATVFMGDTGSIALGGALAAVGIISSNLWALFVVSGIFFIESLSVIVQVGYYKATKDETGKGKRLFKMAPIHHHLELSGWSETQVVGLFYAIAIFLGVLAFFIR